MMSPYPQPKSRRDRLQPPPLNAGNWKVAPSEDELKLRHVQNELSGLQELVVEETGTPPGGWDVICIQCRAKHAREESTTAPVIAQQRALNTYQKQDLWNSTVMCTVCTVHHHRGNQLECPPLCRGTETRHRTHTTWTAGQSCMIAGLPQRQPNPQEARHLVHCRQGHELAPDRLQVHMAMTNVPGRLQVQTRRTTGQNSSMDSYTLWDSRCT